MIRDFNFLGRLEVNTIYTLFNAIIHVVIVLVTLFVLSLFSVLLQAHNILLIRGMPLVLHSSHRTSQSDIMHKNSEVLPNNLELHKSYLTIGIPHFAWSIEWCFGVLKVRFPILNDMYSYSQSRQRLIVTACCALHNFIREYSHSDEMFHA